MEAIPESGPPDLAQRGRGQGKWKDTRASLIARLRRGDRAIALPALFDGYRVPLFEFICAIGCPKEEAADVSQAFFLSMLKPGFFGSFDPARGRFRGWLRGAARNFYWNWRRDHRRERVSLDPAALEERLDGEDDAIERAFDRAFTEILIRRALARLRAQYANQDLFDQLYRAVLGERRIAHDAEQSQRLGRSCSALKASRFKEKQDWVLRYQGCLREEITALGLRRRTSIEGVLAELLDATR